jgi:hypothetical protein
MGTSAVSGRPLVSVLINNFNYGLYVEEAIRSALAQSYHPIEVVVVDDGSTDDSLDRIGKFGDRVRLLTQPNSGMAAAMNRAYEASSGSWIFFLDADDYLHEDCVASVLARVGERDAMAHWRLLLVDGAGSVFGTNPPLALQLAEGDVSNELCRTGMYTGVPTSGNAYARWALESVMPIPVDDFRYSGDGYLNLAVPLLGAIARVEGTLSSYRVHGRNRSTARGALDPARMRIRLEQAEVLDAWLPELAAQHHRAVAQGVVLGHPEFRFMRLLIEQTDGRARPLRSGIAEGLRLTVAATRAPGLRRRRRVLLGTIAPLVPLLPMGLVEHVRDVAYGGKPMRRLRSDPVGSRR